MTTKRETMTQHTPGQAMPVAKTCGCHMEPVLDDARYECDLCSEATGMNDGTGWVIEYCQLHAAAPRMLELLRVLVARVDKGWTDQRPVAIEARAILRDVEEN